MTESITGSPMTQLRDLLAAYQTVKAEEHPESYMNGGKDEHFCDSHECDWDSGHQARLSLVEAPLLALVPALLDVADAAQALADFAYTFKAYPQGLAGQDPLLGVKGDDITTIRKQADALRTALTALNKEAK